MGHVARRGDRRDAYRVVVRKREVEEDNWKKKVINCRMILKGI